INDSFEPVWESVRPAPLVTIDFGNGRQIVRTLQGNCATYVCDTNGTVYDILPGVYTPKPYREQLTLLAAHVKDMSRFGSDTRVEKLKEYHVARAAALNRPVAPTMVAAAKTGFAGKGGIGGFGGGGLAGVGQGGFGGQSGVGGSVGVRPNFGGLSGIGGGAPRPGAPARPRHARPRRAL